MRLDAAGEQLAVTRVDNDPFKFAAVMADAGEGGWLSRVMADPEGNEFCICLVHPDWKG